MPLVLIMGIVGMAISAYTIVQGVKNENPAQVAMGFAGVVGGGLAAAGSLAASGAAAGAAAGETAATTAGATGIAAGEGATNFAQLAGATTATELGSTTGGLAAMGSSLGGAPSALAGAAASQAAPTALQSTGGVDTAVKGLTNLEAPVDQGVGLGTDLKSGFDKTLGFLTENPELTKLGGSLFTSVLDNKTQQANIKAAEDYEERQRIAREEERRNVGTHVAAPVYRR